KAAEFYLECESDVFVAVRIRKAGQIYLLDSSSPSQASYYPPPIQEVLEDIMPQVEPLSESGDTPAFPERKGRH
ncbi:uncharacterized protein BO96DRAFT_417055, partial [Aspergillus niger CBS 101883]|uniref:uncharacterized protein n=1 Tax=Aspergillus lacticoffeatus (strain CBS 101883) TaxID=1450533 RepID=UPI000D7F2B26